MTATDHRGPSRFALFQGGRAFPTLLKIGFAEALAYRAEMLVWMLTSTMPLVSMALWAAVADGRRIGPEGFASPDFVVYFLLTLVVRILTGSWVLWALNFEIRSGALAQRLLRPVHPLLAYGAENMAAVPLRLLLVLPLVAGLLAFTPGMAGRLSHDPLLWLAALLALPAAWALTFLSMVAIGALAFFVESSLALFQLWMGSFMVLSGYLMPLALLPRWLRRAAELSPFRYMLELPVRLAMGLPSIPGAEAHGYALRHLGLAYLHVGGLLLVVALLWRAGLRRYAAFGA